MEPVLHAVKEQPQARPRAPRFAVWTLYGLVAPIAAFEAMAVYSTLAGAPAAAAWGGLALFLVIAAAVAWVFVPPQERRRMLSGVAVALSAIGLVCVLSLAGKVAAARGVAPSGALVAQAALVFVFQIGWAVTGWLSASRGLTTASRFIPAALGGVMLIAGGFMAGGAPRAVQAPDAGAEKFDAIAKLDKLAFARPIERAGRQGRGVTFAHYHTGSEPLLGLALDTRKWMRRERVSGDVRGVFNRTAPAERKHVLVGKPGYVVAAVETSSDEYINALRVRFARLEDSRVSADDAYWSGWVGSESPSDAITELDSYSRLVLGIAGTKGLVLTSLTLLVPR